MAGKQRGREFPCSEQPERGPVSSAPSGPGHGVRCVVLQKCQTVVVENECSVRRNECSVFV